MKKILAVTCTRKSKQDKGSLLVFKSLNLLKHEIDLITHFDNTRGLPEVYNEYIDVKYSKKYDYVLFIHDDVYVDDLKIRGKLYNAHKQFDIVGLAGCLNPVIKKPALWHLMSDRSNWRGYVAHNNKDDFTTINMTTFGPTPSRVVLIDGLFMSVNLKKALDADWKFDESFEFHHYDMASCLTANQKRMTIGVTPINVIHSSPGLSNYHDPKFQSSEKNFLEKYS